MSTKTEKQESKDEVKLKEIDFKVIDYKHKFHNKCSLLTLGINIEGESYVVDFLIDSYEIAYYPEFKTLDRYSSRSNVGDAIVLKFLNSFKMKVSYFAEVYSKRVKADHGINDWDYAQEWWKEQEIEDIINDGVKDWIKKNIIYLSQVDVYDVSTNGVFNDAVDDLQEYLNKRKNFAIPTGFETHSEQSNDIETLEAELKNAIAIENYKMASKIRDKIKKLNGE